MQAGRPSAPAGSAPGQATEVAAATATVTTATAATVTTAVAGLAVGRPSAGWIAATGLALVLFLALHLAGIALAPLAPARFEAYAAALHASPWLPLLEPVLAAAALLHLLLATAKVLANRRARFAAAAPPAGSPGLVSRRGDPLAALAARSAPLSGALLLAFLAVHLAQLRWGRPAAGQELLALRAALAPPAALALYLAAAPALGLHLFHGAEAAHRSLGLLDPTNGTRIRRWGRALAATLAAGFALVPLLLVLRP